MDVAIRELEEETGIKKSEIRIIPNFRTYERFHFRIGKESIYDTVILFLAETRKADVKLIPREHSGYAWFTYEDAVGTIGKKYEDTRRVLRQVRSFLRPKGKPVSPPIHKNPNP